MSLVKVRKPQSICEQWAEDEKNKFLAGSGTCKNFTERLKAIGSPGG